VLESEAQEYIATLKEHGANKLERDCEWWCRRVHLFHQRVVVGAPSLCLCSAQRRACVNVAVFNSLLRLLVCSNSPAFVSSPWSRVHHCRRSNTHD
jgi:hypothetical protein